MENLIDLPQNTELCFTDFENDRVRGFVIRVAPHKYVIAVNTRFSDFEQWETIQHEIYHIEHNHFEAVATGEKTEEQIEQETNEAIGLIIEKGDDIP